MNQNNEDRQLSVIEIDANDDETDVVFLEQAYAYHQQLVSKENRLPLTRNLINRDQEEAEERLMADYFNDHCRSSYARAMIKLRADVELKDNIVTTMPKITREGYYTCNICVEYEWKPSRSACCKVFGHVQEECPKNIASSPSTTPIVEKIDKIEKLIIEGKVTLVDDEGKPLEKVASSCEYDSEDEVALVDNEMANFLAKNDNYEVLQIITKKLKDLTKGWLFKLHANKKLNNTIVVAMTKLDGEGFYLCIIHVEYEWKPPRCSSCKVFDNVLVGCHKKIVSDLVKNLKNPGQATRGVQFGPNVGFKPTKRVDKLVYNKNSGKKKQAELPNQNVSNLNPFDAFSVVENDDNMERQIINGKLTLVDDDGKPKPKVVYTVNEDSDSEVEDVVDDHAVFMASTSLKSGIDSEYGHYSIVFVAVVYLVPFYPFRGLGLQLEPKVVVAAMVGRICAHILAWHHQVVVAAMYTNYGDDDNMKLSLSSDMEYFWISMPGKMRMEVGEEVVGFVKLTSTAATVPDSKRL
nr:hypothetical protein [Tanacetum cinerariifolium]